MRKAVFLEETPPSTRQNRNKFIIVPSDFFFSTLTGGRSAFRLSTQQATEILETDYIPLMRIMTLTPGETVRGMRECQSRGVQGGAIFDYLHLIADRKGKAELFFTLDVSNFRSFQRTGDPEILNPERIS